MCCITQSQLQVSDLSLPFLPGVATTKPTRTSDLLSGPDNVSQNRHREETLSETRNSKLTLYRHSTHAAPQSRPEAQMSEVMLFVHHVSARDSCCQVSSSPQTPTCRKSTRPQEESQATEMLLQDQGNRCISWCETPHLAAVSMDLSILTSTG